MHRGRRDVVATLAKSGANNLDTHGWVFRLHEFVHEGYICVVVPNWIIGVGKYMWRLTGCLSATCRSTEAERQDTQNLWLWLHLTVVSLESDLPQRPHTSESTTGGLECDPVRLIMVICAMKKNINIAHIYWVTNAIDKESDTLTINEQRAHLFATISHARAPVYLVALSGTYARSFLE